MISPLAFSVRAPLFHLPPPHKPPYPDASECQSHSVTDKRMSQLSFTLHDLHIDEAGLCFNSKAPSPIPTKRHTGTHTELALPVIPDRSNQENQPQEELSAHLNVTEHTWRTNRALNKVMGLSTSCVKAWISPSRQFDAGFAIKWGFISPQVKSTVGFCQACHHSLTLPPSILGLFYLLAGLLYDTLLSCPLTRFYCASVEIEKHGSHSHKQRHPCTWTGDINLVWDFYYIPLILLTHMHTLHISFCTCSTPSPPLVHRPWVIEMWEGLGCPPPHLPSENNEQQLSSAPQKDS